MADKNKGAIILLRDIQNHWLWRDKPFSKGQAWIDMLLLANHKDKKWFMGNQVIDIKRGEFITSQSKLSDRWGWGKDRQKVRDFLMFLSNPNPDLPMISCISTNTYTKITILNYNELQKFPTNLSCNERTKTPATENQDPCTNNNVKNVKNNISKDILDAIRNKYIAIKGWDYKAYSNYAIDNKIIKKLLLKAENDINIVLEGLEWISKQNYNWTLGTLLRNWPEFIKCKSSTPKMRNLNELAAKGNI